MVGLGCRSGGRCLNGQVSPRTQYIQFLDRSLNMVVLVTSNSMYNGFP